MFFTKTHAEPALLNTSQATQEIYGEDTRILRQRLLRLLTDGSLDPIAQAHNVQILKINNRFHIPRVVIKALRGEI